MRIKGEVLQSCVSVTVLRCYEMVGAKWGTGNLTCNTSYFILNTCPSGCNTSYLILSLVKEIDKGEDDEEPRDEGDAGEEGRAGGCLGGGMGEGLGGGGVAGGLGEGGEADGVVKEADGLAVDDELTDDGVGGGVSTEEDGVTLEEGVT